MLIGLAWSLCAVLCAVNLKHVQPEKKNLAVGACVFFGFFGICGVLGGLLRSPFLLATSALLAVAILCILAFVYALWNQKTCRKQLGGVYLGFSVYKSRKGHRSYSPVFKYYYAGRWYQSRAYETYSLKKINARFVQGKTYPIWINEKVPDAYITRKGLDAKYLVVLMAGLVVLFMYAVIIFILLIFRLEPQLGLHF